jgi:SEC-C motif/Protein of unknown function (DUF1186)
MQFSFQEPLSQKELDDFYEKRGIRITTEPTRRLPGTLQEEVQKIIEAMPFNPAVQIPKLEKLNEQYPDVPTLKDHLYMAYVNTGRKKAAERIMKEMLEQHPDYVFGISHFIRSMNDKEELLKHGHLLRTPRDISSFQKKRGLVHISEYVSYQQAACHYEALTGEVESAKERLRTLLELGVSKAIIKELGNIIHYAVTLNMKTRLESNRKNRKSVVTKPAFDPKGVAAPPVFEHDIIREFFYQKTDDEMSEEEIASILSLPRESLIADLEKVVMDAIQRWDYIFSEEEKDNPADFLFHAFAFLFELKSEQSLDVVLNCFRMEEDFLNSYFGDLLEHICLSLLYALGEGQLDKLKSYVKEENRYAFDRIQISRTVAQIALHQPERRQEVIDWFVDVLEFHLEHPDNDNLIDTTFLSFTIAEALDFQAVELLPLITKINEQNWIEPDVAGDFMQIKNILLTPVIGNRKDPLPEDIFEFYSFDYLDRKEPMSPEELASLEKMRSLLMNDPVERMLLDSMSDMLGFTRNKDENFDYNDTDEEEDDYLSKPQHSYFKPNSDTPIIRDSPKVGRNDLCPCGSGKKYKKCCLD